MEHLNGPQKGRKGGGQLIRVGGGGPELEDAEGAEDAERRLVGRLLPDLHLGLQMSLSRVDTAYLG